MEEHEIIDRLKREMFSEEARPVAEAVLRERGIDPANPVVPPNQQLQPAYERPWKPRLLPILFAAVAGGVAGRHIGAAMAGALGAGLASAALAWAGWWVGTKLAFQVRKLQSKSLRFISCVVAVLMWALVMGIVGVLASIKR